MQLTFQLPPTTENFPDVFFNNDYIRPDTIENLRDIFNQLIYRNENIFTADVWLKRPNLNEYICHQITFIAERSENGVVGYIYAVDVSKKVINHNKPLK